MKTDHTPSKTAIAPGETIELNTRYGNLSRGKCWGKYYPHQTRATGEFEWVEKSGGTLYLTGPGYYVTGSGDGFNRAARAEFHLAAAEEPATEEPATEEHATVMFNTVMFDLAVEIEAPAGGLDAIPLAALVAAARARLDRIEESGDREAFGEC